MFEIIIIINTAMRRALAQLVSGPGAQLPRVCCHRLHQPGHYFWQPQDALHKLGQVIVAVTAEDRAYRKFNVRPGSLC